MTPIAETLKQTGLFNALSEAEFAAIVKATTPLDLPAGTMIAEEGEVGVECYVIYQGTVQVFTTGDDGAEITLVKREAGEFIGEQALLPGTPNRRNASLRAHSDVTLLRIAKEDFQRVLAQDSPLKDRLLRRGEEQVQDKLLRQSAVFRALHLGGTGDWIRQQTFGDGEVVFQQGDPPERVYLITSGTAGVYEEEDGQRTLIARLARGRTFGERALLEDQPRSATIIAHGELETLSIDGAHFLRLHQQSPELREYMQTLRKIYPLAGRGMMTQYFGKFLDLDCLTTVTSMVDGTSVVSSLVIGHEIFNLSLALEDESGLEKITYRDVHLGLERELVIQDNRIVGVTAYGQWVELGQVYRLVLDQTPIGREQLDAFQREGFLERGFTIPIYQDSDVVCNCLHLTRGELRLAIEAGSDTADDLMEATGAGTVCGACQMSLKEMVGQADWTPVRVSEIVPVCEDIRTFRFTPHSKVLEPAKPGQHILIQAHIDGNWIQRPYTISSAAQETTFREITVKKEPHGLFSGWLFERYSDDALIRISDPQGEYFADLAKPEPIVCLVGGIGMTPALAMCRTIAAEQSGHPLHIDYSVSSLAQVAYGDELRAFADAHENIDFQLRLTTRSGRLKAADVQEMVSRYPNATFYICGPTTYQESVENFLQQAGVPAGRIEVEEFTPVGSLAPAVDRRYFYLGIGLLVAFALQDLLGLKIPFVENIQAGESYKRWSGLLLTLYLAGQFILPVLRARGMLRAAARHYHFHKWQGIFAPLVYYIHSTTVGYAYLFYLSLVYFANVLLGLFNQEIVARPGQKQRFQYYWIMAHIVLSILTVALLIAHIWLVFAFQ